MTEIPVPCRISAILRLLYSLGGILLLTTKKHFLSRGLQNFPARFPLAVCMNLLDGENRLQGEKL
jgi:hypothetical protein